jgi:hypothetical protein
MPQHYVRIAIVLAILDRHDEAGRRQWCSEAPEVLTLRQATMQCHGAP